MVQDSPSVSAGQDGALRPQIDVEKLIGRLVIEAEMVRAAALLERRTLLTEIGRLKALIDKSNDPVVGSEAETPRGESDAGKGLEATGVGREHSEA